MKRQPVRRLKGMRLADAGELVLDVVWDGASVCGVDVRSSRPPAATVLKGKTPEQVMQIVPLLFGVCGRAQEAAAAAALCAARQEVLPHAISFDRQIVCEAMQEHLWRLLLDWPKLLGLEQQERQFAMWHALLRKIAAGEAEMETFRAEFERDWLGLPLAAWCGMNGSQALQAWWRTAASPAARLLARLADVAPGGAAMEGIRLLPAWSATEAQQACAGRWNGVFGVRPDWLGTAAETGAWSYYAGAPLLNDVWRQRGSKALVRVLARLFDMVQMAQGTAAPRLGAASPASGEGVAVVRTARGLLMHHVNLVAGQVADYAIVAPTEWNFHPAGAFAQDMLGVREHNVAQLQRQAHVAVLSLDPCVTYRIEVRHA